MSDTASDIKSQLSEKDPPTQEDTTKYVPYYSNRKCKITIVLKFLLN